MRNPTIRIYGIGNKWFQYEIIITNPDGSIRKINTAGQKNTEIEIPINLPQ